MIAKFFSSRIWIGVLAGFLLPILNRKFNLELSEADIWQALGAIGIGSAAEGYRDGNRSGTPPIVKP
jgi:hypothetical protein